MAKVSVKYKKTNLKITNFGTPSYVSHHEGLGYLPIARIRKDQTKPTRTDNEIIVIPSSSSTEEVIDNVSITYLRKDSIKSSRTTSESSQFAEQNCDSDDEKLIPRLFRTLPNINDITDLSSSTDVEHTSISTKLNSELKGSFTKPIDTTFSLEISTEELSNEDEGIEENDHNISTDDSFEYFAKDDESVNQEKQYIIDLNDEDVEAQMLNFMIKEKQKSALQMEEEEALIEKVVADSVEIFLTNLIDIVVSKCEEVGQKARNALDKRKMMDELIKLWDDYKLAKYLNNYLNQCVVEKYKKSRIYYTIVPSKYDAQYKDGYENSLNLMDFTIQRRRDVADICRSNVESLKLEAAAAREQVENSESRLEKFIMETLLKRQDFQNMNGIVKEQFKRMTAVRNEITNVKTKLLIKQHDVEQVKAKLEAIKYIGGDLTIHEYLNVQADVQSLSQKNEECRAEVARLLFNSKRDINWLSHVRYKNQMLNGNLQRARKLYQKKRNEEIAAHQNLFNATLEHDRLKKEISDIKHEGGLLHFPALMEDYKKVQESIFRKEDRVDDLINKHDYLIWRIRRLLKKHGIEDPETSNFPSLRSSRISRSNISKLSSESIRVGFDDLLRIRPAALKDISSSFLVSSMSLGSSILKRTKATKK